jgi:hypothetical protein
VISELDEIADETITSRSWAGRRLLLLGLEMYLRDRSLILESPKDFSRSVGQKEVAKATSPRAGSVPNGIALAVTPQENDALNEEFNLKDSARHQKKKSTKRRA